MLDRLLARFYDPLMASAERRGLAAVRADLLRGVGGSVLVVGAGTGADLPHLVAADISRLVLVEPSGPMRDHLDVPPPLAPVTEVTGGFAEDLPLDDDSIDHAVLSLVLCSVRDPERAVDELGRVLRPDGTVHVIEHGTTDHPLGRLAQRIATPAWRVVSGGCHLDRDPVALLGRRFDADDLTPTPVPKVSSLGRVSVGVARH